MSLLSLRVASTAADQEADQRAERNREAQRAQRAFPDGAADPRGRRVRLFHGRAACFPGHLAGGADGVARQVLQTPLVGRIAADERLVGRLARKAGYRVFLETETGRSGVERCRLHVIFSWKSFERGQDRTGPCALLWAGR